MKLYINGHLHVQFRWCDLVAIHSWNEEDVNWYIRLTLKDNEILLDYDKKEKWLLIVDTLNLLV